MGRVWLLLGTFFCGMNVLLGAFAAHGLKTTMSVDDMVLFDVATRYMMIHGFGLLALGLWSYAEKWSATFWTGFFFVMGILLFSGSLYTLAFIKIPGIVYLTPTGGLCFLLGWLSFGFSIFSTKNKFL